MYGMLFSGPLSSSIKVNLTPISPCGLVRCVKDWPYSSFYRYVKNRVYPEDWGGDEVGLQAAGFGE
jgi:hypothetical protein